MTADEGVTAGHEGAVPGGPTPVEPARSAGLATWLVVIEGLLLLTTLPGLVPLMFLARDADAVPLIALMLLPLGPALAAAVFAWRRFDEGRGESPAGAFRRGYVLNVMDAVRVWVPALLVLAVLAANLTHLDTLASPVAFGVLGAVVSALVVSWAAHAMLIASLFSFRLRDTVRISAYFVVAKARVSLGAIALTAVAVGVVLVAPVWVLALFAAPLTYLFARNGRPLAAEVERRFVVGAPDAVVGKPWPGLGDGAAAGDDAADGDPTD